MSPTFHQCADKDLVQRLSGLKQHPETGQLYTRDQWEQREPKEEEVDEQEEQVGKDTEISQKCSHNKNIPGLTFGLTERRSKS